MTNDNAQLGLPLSKINVALIYEGCVPRVLNVGTGAVIGALTSKRIDPAQWSCGPHESLANVRCYDTAKVPQVFTTLAAAGLTDTNEMEGFLMSYGVLVARLNGKRFDERSVDFAAKQRLLRLAWRRDPSALKEIRAQIMDGLEAKPALSKDGTVEFKTENLWFFLCLRFLQDYEAGLTKICARTDCEHPYFVQKRRGQNYCSRRCAVLSGVRRLRSQSMRVTGRKGLAP